MLEENEYRFIVESSPNMIWRAGTNSLCNYFNHTWLKFTGRTLAQEVGNGWAESIYPDDLERCLNIYIENFQKQLPFEMEYRLKRYDGEYRWINDRGVPVYEEKGVFYGYIGSCIDVTDRVEGKRLREMAQRDGLTGIFNRQYWNELAEKEYQISLVKQKICSLIMMDIDHFKFINDTYGHLIGDRILTFFASHIQGTIRKEDLFGRFGGDEFILLMVDTSKEQALKRMENIQSQLSQQPFFHLDEQIRLIFSYGVEEINGGKSLDQAISLADKALYEMKYNKYKKT